MEITSANSASSMEPSDQKAPRVKEAPCLRSSAGKRRRATRFTSAGTMRTATRNRTTTTSKGVMAKMISSGARAFLSPTMPMSCSHCVRLASQAVDSSQTNTPLTALSQKK
jgi:hypothetical protein